MPVRGNSWSWEGFPLIYRATIIVGGYFSSLSQLFGVNSLPHSPFYIEPSGFPHTLTRRIEGFNKGAADAHIVTKSLLQDTHTVSPTSIVSPSPHTVTEEYHWDVWIFGFHRDYVSLHYHRCLFSRSESEPPHHTEGLTHPRLVNVFPNIIPPLLHCWETVRAVGTIWVVFSHAKQCFTWIEQGYYFPTSSLWSVFTV